MATSLVRKLGCWQALQVVYVSALLLLSTGANFLASAQHVEAQASEVHFQEAVWTTPKVSEDVLIFQTSFDIRVPCVTTIKIPPSSYAPPVRVIIASPTQSGTYPVILFKHGFLLANCFYTQLFEYLASSGYIVVAPQAVTINPDCTHEINETAEVANWIPENLAVVLDTAVSGGNVIPDVSRLVMAGHSRGGKVAFAMALGMSSVELPSFSALVALDPVDGIGASFTMNPPIVEAGCSHTHNQLTIPALIVGTGYGGDGLFPCAPTCCNHAAYFKCSSAPIIYDIVASEYGHLDFLDDSQRWTSLICKGGKSKAPLRDFSGRLMVAFLQSALEGNQEDTDDIVENWESQSIKLEEPQIYMEEDVLLKIKHISKKGQEAAAV